MRSSYAARFSSVPLSRFISLICTVALCCGLMPSAAFAASDGLQPVPGGSEGVAPIAASAEGGDDDAVSHYASDDAPTAEGSDAASFPEDVSDNAFINQDVELTTVVAQAESTKTFFLAQTLESTRTVPVVSANLPLDATQGIVPNEDVEDDPDRVISTEASGSERSGEISPASTVVGSFEYLGMTFAIEAEGESVALVAADYAKLPEEFIEKQVVAIPDIVTFNGIDYYSVTRIADNVFSTFKKDNANSDYIGCEALFADGKFLDGVDADLDSFTGCTGILMLYIPATVSTIDDDEFSGFDTLRYVVVSDANADYASHDGVLYRTGESESLFVPEGCPFGVALDLQSIFDEVVTSLVKNDEQRIDKGADSLPFGLSMLDESSVESYAAPSLDGFDYVSSWTPTSGVGIMLTDPVYGYWAASLDLAALAETVTVVQWANYGKTWSDPTTKYTIYVENFHIAGAYDVLNYYWNGQAPAYGELYALIAPSYNAGVPSYGNTWLNLWQTFARSSFSFSFCGQDAANPYGASIVLNNEASQFYFRTKPYPGGISGPSGSVPFEPGPGTIGGSSGSVTSTCSWSSLVVPAAPVPPVGYKFKGWFTGPVGGVQMVTGSSDILRWRYYAQYEPYAYTIGFDANRLDASVSPASMMASYDADVDLPKPTCPGYDFMGWNTEADGSGESYSAGLNTKPNLTANGGNVTLYAQWQVRIHAATWQDRGEMLDSVQKDYGTAVTMLDALADRPAYTFEGWKTSTDGNVYPGGSSTFTMPDEDVTFSAVWKLKSCTVVFDPGTGNASEIAVVVPSPDPTSSFAIPAPTARGEGYAFSHWGITDDDEINLWYPGKQLTVEGILAGGYPEADVLESLPMGGTVYHNVITLHAVWIPTISVSTPLVVTMAIDPDTGEMIAGEGYISTTGTSEVSVLSLAYDKTDSSSLGGGTNAVFGGDPNGISLTMASVRDDASDIESAFASASPFTLDLGSQDGIPVTDSTLSAFPKFGNGVSLRIRYGLAFPAGFDIASLTSSLPDKADTEEGSTWSRESYPIANLHYTVGLVH